MADKENKNWFSVLTAPSHIWKGRISWRITMTVFATILLVQTCVLIFNVRNYEGELLSNLQKLGRASLAQAIDPSDAPMVSPVSLKIAKRLFSGTEIEGLTVYGIDMSVLQLYGMPTILKPNKESKGPLTYRSADNNHYEVLYSPVDLRHPYYIAAKIDATDVQPRVVGQVYQTLIIMVLLSGFVTSVLMLVLGQWLLEPIMLLRNNLLNAVKNPETPDVQRMKKETQDEIGIAIRIANDLIRQNANNLKRLRGQAEDKIHKLAYYDALTGLPNRTFFLEKLDDSIRHKVIEEDGRLAILSVDIDHFKDVNDTMGHEIGDKLLEAIGKRLVKALPDDSVVARASADEFMILVYLRQDQPDSTDTVAGIVAAMRDPVSILQEQFQVRVSVGVAQCPDDGMEARQIMKNADIALNRAKEEGRDTVRYYSQDFDRAVQQRFQMLRDLRNALDGNQLKLHYHPQFDLATGRLIGAEALLRWWRPDSSKEGGSYISPVDFIPVAEQSGLIVPIGEWVLRTACETNKMWQDKGLPPFRIAVNISGVQFHRGDIVALVESVLKETQLAPHLLELEVTESVFMENMQTAIEILNQLHRLGVDLAVDDFGTGYSSLSYLRQFPIDRLKIDQSFIRNALTNHDDRVIAKTIITLGHSLNLKVIAEGVETTDHETFLKEEGCDEVQGFKYSKPIPADKMWEFAIAHNRAIAQNSKLSVVYANDAKA
jgi:diguanylate cyclase (GGDEF)-like protein